MGTQITNEDGQVYGKALEQEIGSVWPSLVLDEANEQGMHGSWKARMPLVKKHC